jgi:DNA-directed RNA polymerase subunit M/transcription elongation factor TFIIS
MNCPKCHSEETFWERRSSKEMEIYDFTCEACGFEWSLSPEDL